jgi:hypothetical protein
MVPLLVICTVLPDGKTPVSNAGTLGEVELMTTPPAIVTFTDSGKPQPAIAMPFATK